MLKNLVVFLLLAVSFATAQASELKIGFVDVQYILAKSPQSAAVREKLASEFKERGDALKALQDEMAKMSEQGRKDIATMTENQKVELARQIQEKDQSFKLKVKNFREDQERRLQEEQRILIGKIKVKIDEYSKEQKFDVVLLKDALVYAEGSINISDQVLAKLNAAN